MSSSNVYCFTCDRQQLGNLHADGQYTCAACDSNFCQLEEITQQGLQDHVESSVGGYVNAGATLDVPPLPAGHTGVGGHAQVMIIHETIDISNFNGGLPAGLQMGDYATQDTFEAIMSRLLQAHQPPSQPTAQAVLDGLPRLPVPPAAVEGEASGTSSQSAAICDEEESLCSSQFACCRPGEPCSVCHESFRESEQVLQMPCKHCFHEDCILPWLKEHNTCPVCRHKLDVEEDSPQQEGFQFDLEDWPAAPPQTHALSTAVLEINQQRQQHHQLLQAVDVLGLQLRAARLAAQAQLSHLMNNVGQGTGRGSNETPLAELSDRLSELQRSWDAARHALNVFEVQMLSPRHHMGVHQPPSLVGMQLHQELQAQLAAQHGRARQAHLGAAGPDSRLAPELAMLSQEMQQLRAQHVALQQGYRGLSAARAELLAHVTQEGQAARDELLLRVAENRATRVPARRPTPAGPTPAFPTLSTGMPAPDPEARFPPLFPRPPFMRRRPTMAGPTPAAATLANGEIARHLSMASRPAGTGPEAPQFPSPAVPSPVEVRNAIGDVIFRATQAPAQAVVPGGAALENGGRGMPAAQASNLQRNALAEISQILQLHHQQLQGLAVRPDGPQQQQQRQPGRVQLGRLPAMDPAAMAISLGQVPVPLNLLPQRLQEEVQRRQEGVALAAAAAAAAAHATLWAGVQPPSPGAPSQAGAAPAPSSAPDTVSVTAQGATARAEAVLNAVVPPSEEGEGSWWVMGLPLALMAGALLLVGRRWLTRRG